VAACRSGEVSFADDLEKVRKVALEALGSLSVKNPKREVGSTSAVLVKLDRCELRFGSASRSAFIALGGGDGRKAFRDNQITIPFTRTLELGTDQIVVSAREPGRAPEKRAPNRPRAS
jgi:hypothetical protein